MEEKRSTRIIRFIIASVFVWVLWAAGMSVILILSKADNLVWFIWDGIFIPVLAVLFVIFNSRDDIPFGS